MISEPTPSTEPGSGPAIIGLTGPIGCGKTTVGSMLAELGGAFIDADALARTVTAPGQPALRALRERFGDSVFETSGALDRAALGRIVFEDPAALADLEAIVHPGVRALLEERLERARREGDPFVVVEAIKLIEGGLAQRCDEVWVVECPADVQRRRLAERGARSGRRGSPPRGAGERPRGSPGRRCRSALRYQRLHRNDPRAHRGCTRGCSCAQVRRTHMGARGAPLGLRRLRGGLDDLDQGRIGARRGLYGGLG